MNTRSLQCFLTAAEEMNFSRAAGRLYISQQSLSVHIKKLEESYGVILFERSPHLRLTYAGERMLLHAKNLMACENRLEMDFAYIFANKSSKLSIGISRARSQIFLPLIWERFHPQNPNINISLVETISEKMENLLLNGQIDLYIGINVIENKAMEVHHLAQEKQYCIINRDLLLRHFPNSWEAVLKSCQDGIGLQELILITRMPFILLSPGNRMRISLDYLLHLNNIVPHCIFETLDQNLIFQLSQSGYGVGFISQSNLYGYYKDVQSLPKLYTFPILIDTMNISIDLVTLKNNKPFSYIENFVDITKDVFDEYVIKMKNFDFNRSIQL